MTSRGVEAFRWRVVVARADVPGVQAALRHLAARVVACCPAAASVVSAGLVVGVVEAGGEAVRVSALSLPGPKAALSGSPE